LNEVNLEEDNEILKLLNKNRNKTKTPVNLRKLG